MSEIQRPLRADAEDSLSAQSAPKYAEDPDAFLAYHNGLIKKALARSMAEMAQMMAEEKASQAEYEAKKRERQQRMDAFETRRSIRAGAPPSVSSARKNQ